MPSAFLITFTLLSVDFHTLRVEKCKCDFAMFKNATGFFEALPNVVKNVWTQFFYDAGGWERKGQRKGQRRIQNPVQYLR